MTFKRAEYVVEIFYLILLSNVGRIEHKSFLLKVSNEGV